MATINWLPALNIKDAIDRLNSGPSDNEDYKNLFIEGVDWLKNLMAEASPESHSTLYEALTKEGLPSRIDELRKEAIEIPPYFHSADPCRLWRNCVLWEMQELQACYERLRCTPVAELRARGNERIANQLASNECADQ